MTSVSEVSAIEDSDEESAEERRRRPARKRKVRQRAACSTNRIVTDIASDDRLNKQRRRMANSRAAESPAQRSTRLQALQLRAGQRRLGETEEQRCQTTIERVSTPHNFPLALHVTERRGSRQRAQDRLRHEMDGQVAITTVFYVHVHVLYAHGRCTLQCHRRRGWAYNT